MEAGGPRFRLLGPFDVAGVGRPGLGGPKQRALLATLALSPGVVISTEQLVASVWEVPPASAGAVLQTYVSALRRMLEPEPAQGGSWRLLVTRPPGYLLDVSPDEVDAHVFRALAATGRRELAAGDPAAAAATWRRALDLWRGPALTDLGDAPVARLGQALDQERVDLVEDWVDAELANGGHRQLVPQLSAFVTEQPLRERLRGQLMLSLYRSGRQAESLRAYEEGRTLLAEELGVDPSPDLQRLFEGILRHDASLAPPEAVESTATSPAVGAEPLPVPTSPEPVPSGEPAPPRGAGRPRARRWTRSRLAVLIAVLTLATTVLVLTRAGGPAAAGTLEPGALGLIDLSSGAATDQVALGELPAAMFAHEGSLWAALSGRGVLASTQTEGAHSVREVTLDPGLGGIAFADEALWVTQPEEGVVVRVDAASGRIAQRIQVGGRPDDVVAAGGSIWVTSRLEDTVSRIDPRTGRVVQTVPVGRDPVALAGDDHTLWVAAAGDGTITRIELPAGHSAERLRGVGTPADLVLAGGSLWVSDPSAGTLSRIDTRTGSVVQAVPVARGVWDLAAVSDAVVASNLYDGRIAVLDADTGRVLRRLETGSRPVVVYSDGSRLWAAAALDPVPVGNARVLKVLSTGLVESPDPAWLGGFELTSLTHDGLVGFRRLGGSDGSQIVPDLATAIPLPTDHGRTWVFHLQSGVSYSTGGTVHPTDVRPSFERALAPGLPFFGSLLGADGCGNGSCDLSAGITADDTAGTVTFHLRRPDPDFLTELAMPTASILPAGTGPVVPPESAEAFDWTKFPATGPYRVESVQESTVVLTRNPSFTAWAPDTAPDGGVDRLEVTYQADPGEAVDAVLHGRADLLLDPPTEQLTDLEIRFPTRLTLLDQPATLGLMLDTQRPPFDEPLARRAVATIVDRRAVADAYAGAPARPSCQVLPPVLVGYRPYCPYGVGPGSDRSSPDLAAARRLVRRSGTVGARVSLAVNGTQQSLAPLLAHDLRLLGYRVHVEVVSDEGLYYERMSDPRTRPQSHVGRWGADLPSASSFALLARCDETGAGGLNTAGYCDPRTERLVDRALRVQQVDPAGIADAWHAVDRRLTDTVAWVPLASLQSAVLTSAAVQGLVEVPMMGPALEKLTLGP